LLVLAVSACAYTPEIPPAGNVEVAWQQHQKQMSDLTSWKMTGRIAVSNETDSWHATLQWIQHPQEYTINIIAPFGQGGARVEGNNNVVTMRSDEGKVTQASTAEELMQRQTGWRVPLEGMKYWARGVPAPGVFKNSVLDNTGHLAELSQSDWQIDFRSHQRINNFILPEKVFMTTTDLKVKIVIDEWEVTTR